jgi:hypothetical protein
MKIKCPICHEEIELTQSERARSGYKKFEDHKAACFKASGYAEIMNKAAQRDSELRSIAQRPEEPPQKDDVYTEGGENITQVIRRLHLKLGRIPTETETLMELQKIKAIGELKKRPWR